MVTKLVVNDTIYISIYMVNQKMKLYLLIFFHPNFAKMSLFLQTMVTCFDYIIRNILVICVASLASFFKCG